MGAYNKAISGLGTQSVSKCAFQYKLAFDASFDATVKAGITLTKDPTNPKIIFAD